MPEILTERGKKDYEMLMKFLETGNYKYIKEQRISTKINRNEPCPCGSGLKYKKCCINKK